VHKLQGEQSIDCHVLLHVVADFVNLEDFLDVLQLEFNLHRVDADDIGVFVKQVHAEVEPLLARDKHNEVVRILVHQVLLVRSSQFLFRHKVQCLLVSFFDTERQFHFIQNLTERLFGADVLVGFTPALLISVEVLHFVEFIVEQIQTCISKQFVSLGRVKLAESGECQFLAALKSGRGVSAKADEIVFAERNSELVAGDNEFAVGAVSSEERTGIA